MRLGVPGTEAAPQTDSPSSTGRMPSPHPETNPADPEPSPPRSATSQPRRPARLCRAEHWAGNSHCQPHGSHSWGQPAATITASSLWFPSRPCGFTGAGPNRNRPLCVRWPSLPDRYSLPTAGSTCPWSPALSLPGRPKPLPPPHPPSPPLGLLCSHLPPCLGFAGPWRAEAVLDSSLQPPEALPGTTISSTSVHSTNERISQRTSEQLILSKMTAYLTFSNFINRCLPLQGWPGTSSRTIEASLQVLSAE